jgi:MFS family permease
MQTIALGWLVLDLTNNSGFAIGFALWRCEFAPSLLLSAWGGVLADRFEKRRTLLITQWVQADRGLLGVIVIADVVQLWMVCVLAVLRGGAVVRQSDPLAFVSELVTVTTSPTQSASTARCSSSPHRRPAFAGVLIVTIGTGPCFVVNGLVLRRADRGAARDGRPRCTVRRSSKGEGPDRAGFRYIWRTPSFDHCSASLRSSARWRSTSRGAAAVAKITFHGNAGTYSIITIAMGVPR